jgi:16S rRNA processing protein RimM
MGTAADRVAVGYVARAKGVRGAVRVEVLSHRPDRFEQLSAVVLQKEGRPNLPLRIEAWRPDPPGALVKFAGIETPEQAREALVGGYVTVAREDVAPLPADTYYVFDLVGCRVDDESGRRIGEIAEVLAMPSADVYVVRGEGRELLLPAVADFVVEVNIAERRLVVRGVEELLA